MVYCGKPSKGCSNCRSRKISCDQREPGCLQCQKRNQPCPGYRNLVDLMFRDESSHVIKKATAKARRKAVAKPSSGSMPLSAPGRTTSQVAASVDTSTSTQPGHFEAIGRLSEDYGYEGPSNNSTQVTPPVTPTSASWPHAPKVALLHNPSPNFQELGLAFFFSRYVSADETVAYTRFDFVNQVWRPNGLMLERQQDGVMAGMTALGLAGLANLSKSTKMMDAARESYAIALRKTNMALRDPNATARDSTLLTILILNVFETMMGYSPQTLKAWTEHVNGAAALAQMRGKRQFETDAGMRMFLLLTQSMLISCTTRERPMPQSMIDLRREAGKHLPQDEPSWRITKTVYKLLQARFDIKEGNMTDPDEIVERLSEIDAELDAATKAFPASWYPQVTVIDHDHPAAFRRVCHLYPTQWHTKTWNGLRASRILIHEIIRGTILRGVRSASPRFTPEGLVEILRRSTEMLARLCDAVVGSVPQHFGVVKFETKDGDAAARIPRQRELVREVEDTQTPPESSSVAGTTASSSSSSNTNSKGDGKGISSKSEGSSSPPTAPSPSGPPPPPHPAYSTYQGSTISAPPAATTDPETRRFLLLVSASNMLIWPLYIAGMSSACTPEIRAFVARNLRALADETGIVQARHLGDIVERGGASTSTAQAGAVPMAPGGGAGGEELEGGAREFRAFPVEV